MVIKKSILLLLVVVIGHGLELKLGTEKVVKFEQDKTTLRDRNRNTYYLNGKRDLSNRYISNGTIIISFEGTLDLKDFTKEFKIKLLKTISLKNQTYLFSNTSSLDDGTLCEKIGKKEFVRYSYPNWNSKKTLY